MNLAGQYFTVYLALLVAITAKQFTDSGTLIVAGLDAGQQTVKLVPMLSMLFIRCPSRPGAWSSG